MTCINPLDVLRALKDGFEQHTGIAKEERESYLNFIYEARKEYDELAKTEIQRAFIHSFEDSARSLFDNYLDNVEAFCNHDPITEEEVEPDEKLMRSIEEQIGITDNAKKAFGEEILAALQLRLARAAAGSDREEAVADLKNVVKITTSIMTPDPEQLSR